MMEAILSLQMLSTEVPVDSSCSDSSVSCPSNASCQSHESTTKGSVDSFNW
jgi:hypothetical protein